MLPSAPPFNTAGPVCVSGPFASRMIHLICRRGACARQERYSTILLSFRETQTLVPTKTSVAIVSRCLTPEFNYTITRTLWLTNNFRYWPAFGKMTAGRLLVVEGGHVYVPSDQACWLEGECHHSLVRGSRVEFGQSGPRRVQDPCKGSAEGIESDSRTLTVEMKELLLVSGACVLFQADGSRNRCDTSNEGLPAASSK